MLQKKPIRLTEFWKMEGDFPQISVTVLGVQGKIFTLNPVASSVWLLLDGEHSINDIVEEIYSQVEGVNKSIVLTDIVNLLKRFDQDDLIILNYDPLCPKKILKSRFNMRR